MARGSSHVLALGVLSLVVFGNLGVRVGWDTALAALAGLAVILIAALRGNGSARAQGSRRSTPVPSPQPCVVSSQDGIRRIIR